MKFVRSFTVISETAGEAVKTSVTAGKAVFSSKKLRRDWLEAKKNLTRCEEREKGSFDLILELVFLRCHF